MLGQITKLNEQVARVIQDNTKHCLAVRQKLKIIIGHYPYPLTMKPEEALTKANTLTRKYWIERQTGF